MTLITKVQRPTIVVLSIVLTILTACQSEESEKVGYSSSSVDFIAVRNINNAIKDCDELIDLYKQEIDKKENTIIGSDSGMMGTIALTRLGQLNQKLIRNIAELENLSPDFTPEQLEKFKIMEKRFYFHEMRTSDL